MSNSFSEQRRLREKYFEDIFKNGDRGILSHQIDSSTQYEMMRQRVASRKNHKRYCDMTSREKRDFERAAQHRSQNIQKCLELQTSYNIHVPYSDNVDHIYDLVVTEAALIGVVKEVESNNEPQPEFLSCEVSSIGPHQPLIASAKIDGTKYVLDGTKTIQVGAHKYECKSRLYGDKHCNCCRFMFMKELFECDYEDYLYHSNLQRIFREEHKVRKPTIQVAVNLTGISSDPVIIEKSDEIILLKHDAKAPEHHFSALFYDDVHPALTIALRTMTCLEQFKVFLSMPAVAHKYISIWGTKKICKHNKYNGHNIDEVMCYHQLNVYLGTMSIQKYLRFKALLQSKNGQIGRLGIDITTTLFPHLMNKRLRGIT